MSKAEGLSKKNGGISTATILTMVGAYVPAYKAGGPIRSIENLVASLGNEFRFLIVTADRDLGDDAPFPGIVANQWHRVGLADVMYISRDLRGLRKLLGLLCAADQDTVLYLNSLFNRPFSMLPLLLRWLGLSRPGAVVLAPRGELFPAALRFKPGRKEIYIRLGRLLGILKNLLWQASSHFEALAVLEHFPGVRVLEAGPCSANMVLTAMDLPAPSLLRIPPRRPKESGRLRAVFLARVSRIKNLSGALRFLCGVSGEVSLEIFGPLEDREYWQECEVLIAGLPSNIEVRYCGEIDHDGVWEVFSAHELLLLPTLGENFGHVILEALASGCPVLISDRTPWRNLEAEGVGWDIPLDETDRFRAALQSCVDGDGVWFERMSSRARDFANRHASDPVIAAANRHLLEGAINLAAASRRPRSGR